MLSSSLACAKTVACLNQDELRNLKPIRNPSAPFVLSKKAISKNRGRSNAAFRVYSAQRGTQIFRSNKKEEEPAPKKPAFGTQIFRFNKKADEVEEEEEKPAQGTGFSLAKVQDFPGIGLFQRRQADPNTVFVAGATGLTGTRVSLELLRAGFKVRAGVDDLEAAQQLAEVATTYGLITKEEAKKLNVVEFNPREAELIAKAVGNANKVVLSVGESENGPNTTFTNKDALVVVKAAELANVANLIVIFTGDGSSSESPIGFFSRIFSFFKGKSSDLSSNDLIEKIAETSLNFTIIKAGSTSNIPDSSSSNIVVSEEGSSAEGGKISRLQLATVVAEALKNTALTENKVFEVSASESAPVKSLEEYFSALPQDQRRENIALAKAKLIAEEKEKATKAAAFAEAEQAKAEALAAAKLAKALELEAKQIADQEARAAAAAEKAAAQAEVATTSVKTLEEKVKEVDQVIPKSSPFSSFKLPDLAPAIKAGTQKISVDKIAQGIDFSALASKLPSKPKTIFGTAKGSTPEPAVKAAPKSAPKPTPKPAPKPAPTPVATDSSKSRRPLKQRIVKPTAEKPVKPEVQKPAEKKKVLGGLFTQETIFVDEE